MSHLISLIKNEPFKFVIKTPGKCFKSKIARRDKVLLLVLNKGYIETNTLDVCYYITAFLDTHRGGIFVPVGNIEKVKLTGSNTVVYRQRIYFKSFSVFLRVMKELNASIIISDDFRVTTNTLMNVLDDLPKLERYAKDFKMDVDSWLTKVCKILIYEACKKLDMCDMINLNTSVYDLPKDITGFLNRAPLLCGSYSIVNHTSSVFMVEDTSNKVLYDNDTYYKSAINYGYTDNNIKEDIKKGVFKF